MNVSVRMSGEVHVNMCVRCGSQCVYRVCVYECVHEVGLNKVVSMETVTH